MLQHWSHRLQGECKNSKNVPCNSFPHSQLHSKNVPCNSLPHSQSYSGRSLWISKNKNFYFCLLDHIHYWHPWHMMMSLSFTVSGTTEPWCTLTSQSFIVSGTSDSITQFHVREVLSVCIEICCASATFYVVLLCELLVLALSLGCNVPFNEQEVSIFISLFRFVKCEAMAQHAVRAVQEGQLKIDPDVFEKTWYSWLHYVR